MGVERSVEAIEKTLAQVVRLPRGIPQEEVQRRVSEAAQRFAALNIDEMHWMGIERGSKPFTLNDINQHLDEVEGIHKRRQQRTTS